MLTLIWLHFFADFILQNDTVAKGKSSSVLVCLFHSTVYSLPFLWFGWQFLVLTLCSHFLVDAVSSRIAKWFFLKEQRHWFFVTIGADQAIHMSILYLTWVFLTGGNL